MVLPESEIRRIYEEDIKPALFKNVNSVEKPTCVFLAGQPGAGKANLADISVKELNNNAVVFNPDGLRVFHPTYDEKTQQFSGGTREWKNMIIEDCIKEKKNIVFDITLGGNLGVIEQDLTKFKDNGFNTKLNALAVNDSVSKLGFNYRYEDQLNKLGNGRPMDLSYHNEIYKNIPNNITTVIGKGLIDEMSIYKRNHETRDTEVIQNFDRNVLKHGKDSPIYEFDKERARAFTDNELKYLKTWYENTATLAYKNGSTNDLKNSINTDDTRASDKLIDQIKFIKDTKNLIPNLELKDSVAKNNPKLAYDAIVKGADVSVLKKGDFDHLNKIEANILKINMQRGLDSLKKDMPIQKPLSPTL